MLLIPIGAGSSFVGTMTASIPDSVLRPFSTFNALLPSQQYRPLETKSKEIRVAELFPKAFRIKTERRYLSCYTRTISL